MGYGAGTHHPACARVVVRYRTPCATDESGDRCLAVVQSARTRCEESLSAGAETSAVVLRESWAQYAAASLDPHPEERPKAASRRMGRPLFFETAAHAASSVRNGRSRGLLRMRAENVEKYSYR